MIRHSRILSLLYYIKRKSKRCVILNIQFIVNSSEMTDVTLTSFIL